MSTSETYRLALATALEHEGGYVNDPADRGGETYRGVSRKHWPEWPGWAHVDDAKLFAKGDRVRIDQILADKGEVRKSVADFYREKFWAPLACDALAQTDAELAARAFNAGINVGTGRVGKWLQDSLNRIKVDKVPPLVVDGQVGARTLQALALIDHPQQLRALKLLLQVRQVRHYEDLAAADPGQAVFLRGWYNRAAAPVLPPA